MVYYEIDENESKHVLSLDDYGQREAARSLVLLEQESLYTCVSTVG